MLLCFQAATRQYFIFFFYPLIFLIKIGAWRTRSISRRLFLLVLCFCCCCWLGLSTLFVCFFCFSCVLLHYRIFRMVQKTIHLYKKGKQLQEQKENSKKKVVCIYFGLWMRVLRSDEYKKQREESTNRHNKSDSDANNCSCSFDGFKAPNRENITLLLRHSAGTATKLKMCAR